MPPQHHGTMLTSMAMKSPARRGRREHRYWGGKGRQKRKEKTQGKKEKEHGGEKRIAQEGGKRLKQGEGQGETSKKKASFRSASGP